MSHYQLAAIMLAVAATGGYFLASKSQNHDPAKSFGTITPAWEAHKPGDNVSEWKHRFKTRRGTEGDLGTILTSTQAEGTDKVSQQFALGYRTKCSRHPRVLSQGGWGRASGVDIELGISLCNCFVFMLISTCMV